MSFSDYFNQAYYSPGLPDWTQLGERLFIVDGVNPNMALDGWPQHDRIMGVLPQQSLGAPSLTGNPGTALEDGVEYRYGVSRVVTVGSLELESAVTTVGITNNAGAMRNAQLTLDEYEYNPESGSTWTISYRIYRSLNGSTTLLYLVTELTQAQFDALSGGVYTDTTAEADLDLSVSYNFGSDATDSNMFMPPVSAIRAWKGRLVGGGTTLYETGDVTVGAGALTTVTLNSPGKVRACDVGATLWIDGEDNVFTITAADETAGTWTVSSAVSGAKTNADFAMYRDSENLYVTNPLPANIEGYDEDVSPIFTNLGSGQAVKGIGIGSNDYCYVFRESAVEVLETDGSDFQLVRIVAGVGCASQATVSDRHSPEVFWYAGRAGVWRMSDGTPKRISDAIEPIIRDEIDHSMNAFSHGVYDPQRDRYLLWVFGSDWSDYGARVPQKVLVWENALGYWWEFELAAAASGIHRKSDGSLGVVVGLAGGTAWLDDDVSYDGASISGTVDSATASTLTDATAGFTDDLASLAGLPVHVTHASGTIERRIIRSNTATELTIWGTWGTTPTATATYVVGAIRWHAETQELQYADSFNRHKQFERAIAICEPDTQSNTVTMAVQGVRADSAKESSQNFNINGVDSMDLRGANLGLRGRSCKVRWSGDGVRPVAILSLSLESTVTRRK